MCTRILSSVPTISIKLMKMSVSYPYPCDALLFVEDQYPDRPESNHTFQIAIDSDINRLWRTKCIECVRRAPSHALMEADWQESARIALPGPSPNAPSSPVTTFAFDTEQELLWTGNEYVSAWTQLVNCNILSRLLIVIILIMTCGTPDVQARAASRLSAVLNYRGIRPTGAM